MTTVNDIRKCPLFTNFSKDELMLVSKHIQVKHYCIGETIMLQGSYGDELYILTKGNVLVYVTLPGDAPKVTTKLKSGQIFGEVSFLTQELITASIIAEDDCICLSCSREILIMLHFAYPEIAYKFETNIIQQIREKIIHQLIVLYDLLETVSKKQTLSQHALYLLNNNAQCTELQHSMLDLNHITPMRFFQTLNEQEVALLLSFMTYRQYERGYQFQTEDSKNSRLCILCSGAVMMFIKKDNMLIKAISVSGVGELFLENPSVIFPKLQEYTAYLASEQCTILELDFAAYYKMHHSHPKLFFHISTIINHHIARLIYILNRQFVRIYCEYNPSDR
jgi:CRP-like cAMP-binding protein